MRVTAIKTQTERKRQGKSVHCTEKRGRRARVMRAQALLPDRARRSARKTLDPLARSDNLDVEWHATWGMSA
jgi:hypothetical protein